MIWEKITAENVATIQARDLRDEAHRSLDAVAETGRDAMGGILKGITRWLEPHHADASITVETVSFESSAGDRAGQSSRGPVLWGDWDERKRVLVTDDGTVVHLDGREVTPPVESGFYGTERETFVVGEKGGVYLVQGPDMRPGELFQRVNALPVNVRRLAEATCRELTIPDECWEN